MTRNKFYEFISVYTGITDVGRNKDNIMVENIFNQGIIHYMKICIT
jgi:hypothetical protein